MLKNDHFAFAVSDMDRAVGFYCGELGMKLLFREHNENDHEIFAMLELDGGNLELIQSLDENDQPVHFEKPKIRRPFCPHIAFPTKSMEETMAMVAAKEIPVVDGPTEIPGAEKWVYLSDPDNNIIEFIEWADGAHGNG